MTDPVEQRVEQEPERDEERPAEHPAGERDVEQDERPEQRLNQLYERKHLLVDWGAARVPVGARLIQPRERQELAFVESAGGEAEAGRQILHAEAIRD